MFAKYDGGACDVCSLIAGASTVGTTNTNLQNKNKSEIRQLTKPSTLNPLIPNITNICIPITLLTYFVCYMLREFVSTLTQLIPGDHFLYSHVLYA